jgi:hypothetical protein
VGVRQTDKLIGIWFLARPLVLDATRVKENWFSLSFIAGPSCQTGPRASTGKFSPEVLPVFWRFWVSPDGVGRRQGRNGQAMREKWRGSAAGRAQKGRCPAEARLQTTLEKSSSQSVSAFS